MTNAKEVRELQFTRMQLVIVFVLVIALGAFIFVLGVSVGKKQARLAQGLEPAAGPSTEVVRPKVKPPTEALAEKAGTPPSEKASPADEKKVAAASSDIRKEIASFEAQEKTGRESPAVSKSTPAAKTGTATPAPKKTAARRSVPAAVEPQIGLLYIQVVAASQKSEASQLADKIREHGFSVFILDPRAGTPFYRVRVGGYRTEEERNRAGERLAAVLKKKPSDFYYPPR
ncbi:MAG: SPOR domain-containing protein [Candidatus Aminicenantes bacterium]|nr:SPOR domain-containing protein [Candidatus Aminicenantes bacterium]